MRTTATGAHTWNIVQGIGRAREAYGVERVKALLEVGVRALADVARPVLHPALHVHGDHRRKRRVELQKQNRHLVYALGQRERRHTQRTQDTYLQNLKRQRHPRSGAFLGTKYVVDIDIRSRGVGG